MTIEALLPLTLSATPPVITPVALAELFSADEAPKELKLKVRKSDDTEGLPTLEASIRAHGVIVPLVVKEHQDRLYVSAGNRRLQILRKLFSGVPGVLVQTINSDDINGDPREIAMATNVALPPHPVDRYEIISELIREGMNHEDAKQRFGMTDKQFAQTMRLGTMHPELRDLWRSGLITGDVVKALALTDDQTLQLKTFKTELKSADSSRDVRAHEIRRKIIGDKQMDSGRLVAFVGESEVLKAKIKFEPDLFGANHHKVTDLKGLQRLAGDKVNAACSELIEQGWSWAAPKSPDDYLFTTINPEEERGPNEVQAARLAEIERELAHLEGDDDEANVLNEEGEAIEAAAEASGYSAKQRAESGCFVSVGRHGHLEIVYGKVKPADRRRAEAASPKPASSTPKKTGPASDVRTAALAGKVSEWLTTAAGAAIVRQPDLANAALITGFMAGGPVDINRVTPGKKIDFAANLAGNIKGSPENRKMLLAQICAQAIDLFSNNPDAPPLKDPDNAALCNAIDAKAMNKALREAFDAKEYFNGIDKEWIGQAVFEAMGQDHAAKVARMKRGEAAVFAAGNVPKTGWLPPWMRTAHYDGPAAKAKPKAVKKAAKKPAAKKK